MKTMPDVELIDGNSLNRTFRVRIMAALTASAGALTLFTALFVIPRFAEIFGDMLGNQPLPWATRMVLQGRSLWVALGCIWTFAPLCVMERRHALRYCYAIMGFVVVQMMVTVLNLMIPMVSIIRQIDGRH